jgi:hypothetical protein
MHESDTDPCHLWSVLMLQWSLYIEPKDGWGVPWKGGLCAMVIILSIILSLLIFMLLVSR